MSAGLLVAAVAPATADDRATARLETGGVCELIDVAERTNDLLGRAAVDPTAAARLRVDTTRAGEQLVATLELVDETGAAQPPRTITAHSCEELGESLAVVISIVLRRDAAAPWPASIAPPLEPPPATPAPPPAPEPPLRLSEEDEAGHSLTPVAARATVIDVGAAMATSRTSVLVAGGRLERERAAFGLALAVAIPSTVELGTGSAHVRIASLQAAACARRGRMSACGTAAAGAVYGSGEDLIEARSAVRPIAGLGVRVDWRQSVSRRLGVVVFAEAEQRLLTTRFLVDAMPVWTSPPRQASLGAGVFLRVP